MAPLAEDVITGLEFLVDLPMGSFVDQQDERKIIVCKFFLGLNSLSENAPKMDFCCFVFFPLQLFRFFVFVVSDLIFDLFSSRPFLARASREIVSGHDASTDLALSLSLSLSLPLLFDHHKETGQ